MKSARLEPSDFKRISSAMPTKPHKERAGRFWPAPLRRSAHIPTGMLASRRFGSAEKSPGQNARYITVTALEARVLWHVSWRQ